jgi:2-polyprenyl-3-methyl-5-hydroxy-6-metoxy-1,4-benzoquinol methylase
MKKTTTRFDRDYYRRFYLEPRTAVTSAHEMVALGNFIAAYTQRVGLPVKRILDAGCGIGLLRRPLLKQLPRATYTGMEISEYLCERYGWVNSTVQEYRSATPFDLVICNDIAQYFDERSMRRAAVNLGRLCRGVLFFSALTASDWRNNCDQTRTDPNVLLRPAEWYREHLRRHFREVGAGLWLPRGSPLIVWELETAYRPKIKRHSGPAR